MNLDFSAMVQPLILQLLTSGILVRVGLDFLRQMFKKVDDSGLAGQHKGWLDPLLMILTMVVSALSLAQDGKLHDLNLDALGALVQGWALTLMAAKSTGTKTVTEVAEAVKTKVTQ